MKAHFQITTVLLLLTFNCFSQTVPPRQHPQHPQHPPKGVMPLTEVLSQGVKPKVTTKGASPSVTAPLSRTEFKIKDSLLLRNRLKRHN